MNGRKNNKLKISVWLFHVSAILIKRIQYEYFAVYSIERVINHEYFP